MDIGANFQDDFFEEPKVKVRKPQDYQLKIVAREWFNKVDEPNLNPREALTVAKYQADHRYHKKEYHEAAGLYEKCLELVPENNNTWKREFMENLARCFLHMDKPQKALEWGLKLEKNSINPDQKTVAMNFLATVCHKLGKYEEELEALHFCLQTHKACPEFWIRLGLCYAGLFRLPLPSFPCEALEEPCCQFRTKSLSSPAEVPSLKCQNCAISTNFVSTCFVHATALLKAYTGGNNPIEPVIEETSQENISRISNCLRYMEVEQTFIDVASEMLGPPFLAQLQACDKKSEEEPEENPAGTSQEVVPTVREVVPSVQEVVPSVQDTVPGVS